MSKPTVDADELLGRIRDRLERNKTPYSRELLLQYISEQLALEQKRNYRSELGTKGVSDLVALKRHLEASVDEEKPKIAKKATAKKKVTKKKVTKKAGSKKGANGKKEDTREGEGGGSLTLVRRRPEESEGPSQD